jgi:cytochrome c5
MRAKNTSVAASGLLLLTLCFTPAALATQTGLQVFQSTCAACHTDGKDGAPKSGDLKAWGQRAEKGFDKLAAHAIAGTGKMPAHGGDAKLSDLEISRAISYMASGGRAADPKKSLGSHKTAPADTLVKAKCSECHGNGKDGAPRMHVFADWKPRLQNGIDSLVASAINGHNKMPARAGMPQLSDEDIKSAVIYMLIPNVPGKH